MFSSESCRMDFEKPLELMLRLPENFFWHVNFISIQNSHICYNVYRSVFCTCCKNVLPLPSWVDFHIFHPQRPSLQPRLTVYRRLESSGWWWWRADWGVWGRSVCRRKLSCWGFWTLLWPIFFGGENVFVEIELYWDYFRNLPNSWA